MANQLSGETACMKLLMTKYLEPVLWLGEPVPRLWPSGVLLSLSFRRWGRVAGGGWSWDFPSPTWKILPGQWGSDKTPVGLGSGEAVSSFEGGPC